MSLFSILRNSQLESFFFSFAVNVTLIALMKCPTKPFSSIRSQSKAVQVHPINNLHFMLFVLISKIPRNK